MNIEERKRQINLGLRTVLLVVAITLLMGVGARLYFVNAIPFLVATAIALGLCVFEAICVAKESTAVPT